MRLAELQIAAKDNTPPWKTCSKALAIQPDLVDAQRAVIASDVASGRTDEALAAAREVQKRRPKESAGYILEGNIHVSKKAWSEAATAYRAGLNQAGTTDLAVDLHSVLLAAGKGPEADSFAATWLKEHPKDRGFRFNLAQNAIGKKDYRGRGQTVQGAHRAPAGRCAGAQQSRVGLRPAQGPEGGRVRGARRQARARQPSDPRYAWVILLVEKGDTKRGRGLAAQGGYACAPMNRIFASIWLARWSRPGKRHAAKKELETLAKLGDKFAQQAEVAKLMQTL